MYPRIMIAGIASVFLLGCDPESRNVDLSATGITGRAIRPPQSDVRLGGLYYVANAELSPEEPLPIESLCLPNVEKYGVALPTASSIGDIDLLSSNTIKGGLSGLKTKFISIGLSGEVSDYFALELKGAKKLSITRNDADEIFNGLSKWRECNNWRKSVQGLPVYQIQAVYYGDLAFSRKYGTNVDANLTVKLTTVEPAVKAALGRELRAGVTGKALVVSVVPITR